MSDTRNSRRSKSKFKKRESVGNFTQQKMQKTARQKLKIRNAKFSKEFQEHIKKKVKIWKENLRLKNAMALGPNTPMRTNTQSRRSRTFIPQKNTPKTSMGRLYKNILSSDSEVEIIETNTDDNIIVLDDDSNETLVTAVSKTELTESITVIAETTTSAPQTTNQQETTLTSTLASTSDIVPRIITSNASSGTSPDTSILTLCSSTSLTEPTVSEVSTIISDYISINTTSNTDNSYLINDNLSKVPSSVLFYEDARPGAVGNTRLPLYDVISDDSFDFTTPGKFTPKSRKNHSQNSIGSIIMASPKQNNNDSVIFVSETFPNDKQANSIESVSRNKKRRNRRKKNPTELHAVHRARNRLKITLNSMLDKYKSKERHPKNVHILKPVLATNIATTSSVQNNINKDDSGNIEKRMIFIDGSNVAFGHSCNNIFSVKGIQICIEYFEKRGHEIQAVVPRMRLKKSMSSDSDLLDKLHKEGKIVLTPCKNLPGKCTTSYDDRFIMELATEFNAAIISNDNYRDLIMENPIWKEIAESRVIGFSWCKDMILFPQDPYGRDGPTLHEILYKK